MGERKTAPLAIETPEGVRWMRIGSLLEGEPAYEADDQLEAIYMQALKSPFPAFGGKSAIAPLVWERFGSINNYVEPFVNSAAVALACSYVPAHETWNDLNGFVSNFWRATSADPDAVAAAADWIIHECDLHARHAWLVRQQPDLAMQLMGDPDWYDAKVAGWWLWGICQWIGSGWCSGQGPWTVSDDGRLINGDAGRGINRQLPHLGDAGRGINRKLPHLGDAGRGQCDEWSEHLRGIMRDLRDRLRRVRVCCGDWSRVCGPAVTWRLGTSGIFLDPPYFLDDRDDVYANFDSDTVARDAQEWAVKNGNNPLLRIALCGYEGHYDMPQGWSKVSWKANGGYSTRISRGSKNRLREVVWFSPHCLNSAQLTLGI